MNSKEMRDFAKASLDSGKITKIDTMTFLRDYLSDQELEDAPPLERCPLRLARMRDGNVLIPEGVLSTRELRTLARYLVIAADGGDPK